MHKKTGSRSAHKLQTYTKGVVWELTLLLLFLGLHKHISHHIIGIQTDQIPLHDEITTLIQLFIHFRVPWQEYGTSSI